MSRGTNAEFISVIMPAYNSELYIEEAVKSVLSQTYKNFELIIVDDGSTDSTSDKIKQFNDHRIRYIYQDNAGQSRARNAGIKQSNGEYIALIDSDDIWINDKLEKQINKFRENPDLGLVYGWIQSIYPDGSPKLISKPIQEGWVHKELLLGNFLHNGSMQMIRKQCFDKIGLFDEDIPVAEDVDLWLRLSKHYKFGVVKDIIVKYRVVPNSLSKNVQKLEMAHKKIIAREFKNADKSLKKIKGKTRSNHYFYLFQICYSTGKSIAETQKYLFLSFFYDPFSILQKISLKRIFSFFKLTFVSKALLKT